MNNYVTDLLKKLIMEVFSRNWQTASWLITM